MILFYFIFLIEKPKCTNVRSSTGQISSCENKCGVQNTSKCPTTKPFKDRNGFSVLYSNQSCVEASQMASKMDSKIGKIISGSQKGKAPVNMGITFKVFIVFCLFLVQK